MRSSFLKRVMRSHLGSCSTPVAPRELCGQPHTIINSQMSHLCLPLHSLAQCHRDRLVVTCDDQCTTAAELHDRVALLSKGLSNKLSVGPGDRVGLLGINTDVFFLSLLAVLDAGAVGCPLNWRWSAAELAAAISLLQPNVLFVDDHHMSLAAQACRLAAHSSPLTLVQMHLLQTAQGGRQQHGIFSRTFTVAELLQSSHQAAASQECRADRAPAGDKQLHSQNQAPMLALSARELQQACSTPPQLQLLQPGPQQPALIVFTSGTTGASKGVMLSHDNMIHQSMAKLAVVQYSSSDTYLHMAPLFHVGGLSSAFAVLLAGGRHVFMPHYSPTTTLQLLQQHDVTALIAVPAMMQDLTQAAAAATAAAAASAWPSVPQPVQQQHASAALAAPKQLPSLLRVLVGAGGMQPRLQRAVAALFPNAELQTAYGMTEASSSITFISVPQQQRLMAAAAAAGATAGRLSTQVDKQPSPIGVCVGIPGPGIAVKIALSATTSTISNRTPPPQQQKQQQCQFQPCSTQPPPDTAYVVGEVCTRGPHVMLGYWRDPAATAAVLAADGWLHTGDLGYLDPTGHLWLVGRCKDMIKTGGENVHAAEVESLLLTHPAVGSAAVFGLEHERLREQVAAAVVLQPGWSWAGPTTQLLGVGLSPAADSSTQQLQEAQQGVSLAQTCVSAADLQQHCRAALLSPYKLPRVLVCVQQLPLNSSGKVVKAVLKQQVQQHLAACAASRQPAQEASRPSLHPHRQHQQQRSKL